MDTSKHYSSRYEATAGNTDRSARQMADRRKENTFQYRGGDAGLEQSGNSLVGDNSVRFPTGNSIAGDSSGRFPTGVSLAGDTSGRFSTGTSLARDASGRLPAGNNFAVDSSSRFPSPRRPARERTSNQLKLQPDQLTPKEDAQRIEWQLHQSFQVINQKKQMQQDLHLMQQQQQQQQQQQSHQSQPISHSIHPPASSNQQYSRQQLSPARSQREPSADIRLDPPMPDSSRQYGESPVKVQFSESFEDMTVGDLYLQCQNHLNVINACTDLQQAIKDEMKKQAKLDSIVSQKMASKAQRLQQQADLLERANAPAWVGPALQDLSSQVGQQAEVHNLYMATLMDQCVVIQVSLDGHHELMKSVLTQPSDTKQATPATDPRNRNFLSPPTGPDQTSWMKVECQTMTFLQASNIFEGIRKPRMKLLSSLEYQQEQLNATLQQIGQVDAEIESLSKREDNDNNLVWRVKSQKNDLEIRREFLEQRREQLESDVQFARMDLSDFEYSNKDSLLEVLNVFHQHRIRYDTTLKQSFNLLKAASLRDVSFLGQLSSKKNDQDLIFDFDRPDRYDTTSSGQGDPWGFSERSTPKMNVSSNQMSHNNGDSASVQSGMSQAVRNSLVTAPSYKHSNPFLHSPSGPEPTEGQGATPSGCEPGYQVMLSSDSDVSFLSKTDLHLPPRRYPNSCKANVKPATGVPKNFQNLSDFNFSRAESSTCLTDVPESAATIEAEAQANAHDTPPAWSVVKEQVAAVQRCDKHIETGGEQKDVHPSHQAVGRNGRSNQLLQNCPSKGKEHTESILIMSRGTKKKPTLGNFEADVGSEASGHCLYPTCSMREISVATEDRRASHFIKKYASGPRGGHTLLCKNWNSSCPFWGKGNRQEYVSSLAVIRGIRGFRTHRRTQYSNRERVCLGSAVAKNFHCPKHVSGSQMVLDCVERPQTSFRGLRSGEQVINARKQPRFKSTHTDKAHEASPELSPEKDNNHNDCLNNYTRENRTAGACWGTFSDGAFPEKDLASSEDATKGQVSTNDNNCLPPKVLAVDAGNLPDNEDHLEFEMVHALFPPSIRVCAVRPITADGDTTVTKSNVSVASSQMNAADRHKGKYEALKMCEVTAGTFILGSETAELSTHTSLRERVKDASCSQTKKEGGLGDTQEGNKPKSASKKFEDSFSRRQIQGISNEDPPEKSQVDESQDTEETSTGVRTAAQRGRSSVRDTCEESSEHSSESGPSCQRPGCGRESVTDLVRTCSSLAPIGQLGGRDIEETVPKILYDSERFRMIGSGGQRKSQATSLEFEHDTSSACTHEEERDTPEPEASPASTASVSTMDEEIVLARRRQFGIPPEKLIESRRAVYNRESYTKEIVNSAATVGEQVIREDISTGAPQSAPSSFVFQPSSNNQSNQSQMRQLKSNLKRSRCASFSGADISGCSSIKHTASLCQVSDQLNPSRTDTSQQAEHLAGHRDQHSSPRGTKQVRFNDVIDYHENVGLGSWDSESEHASFIEDVEPVYADEIGKVVGQPVFGS